jgi:hypothetical protein
MLALKDGEPHAGVRPTRFSFTLCVALWAGRNIGLILPLGCREMSKILLFRYILCQSVWPLTTSSKVKPSFQRYFFIDASDGFLLLFLLTYCAYFTKDHFIYARCLEKLSTID